MVTIKDVVNRSKAYKAGIRKGDILISLNGKKVSDVLDYIYQTTDNIIDITYLHKNKEYTKTIEKDDYEDIGLVFDDYLMDRQKSCTNKCIFCFIDQMPKGMRETLYFKDDDTRLSFLQGNYVTLTNMSEDEIQRIIDYKISPVNISVHTLNPQLRIKMLNNKNAGKINDIMQRFYKAGINMHCQIVLCKGINDKDELDFTLHKLYEMYPMVSSVAIVPAGLTKFRQGLYELEEYDEQSAKEVIAEVEAFADYCKKTHGEYFCYAADEFYIKAKLPVKDYDYYGDFEQLENGIGMAALFIDEFENALDEALINDKSIEVSMATGECFYEYLDSCAKKLKEKFPNLKCNVHKIKNDFFGHSVTVSGLLCGCDIVSQLKEKQIYKNLFLPKNLLRSNTTVLLDDIEIKDIEKALCVDVKIIEDGKALIDKINEL